MSFFPSGSFSLLSLFQDRQDDPKAGVRSTALLIQDRKPKLFLSFLAACFVYFLDLTGQIIGMPWYFRLTVTAAAVHVGWQVSTVNLDDPLDCFAKFYSNVSRAFRSVRTALMDAPYSLGLDSPCYPDYCSLTVPGSHRPTITKSCTRSIKDRHRRCIE